MSKIQKVLMTGKSHTTSSEAGGLSRSAHGKLNMHLTTPGDISVPEQTFSDVVAHPTAEQLFAAAWSACYISAVNLVAKEKEIVLPPDASVDVDIDLGISGKEYLLGARIHLHLPGIDQAVATELAHAADVVCPYSKATRGNIDVVLTATTA